jgi:hypothetical protein
MELQAVWDLVYRNRADAAQARVDRYIEMLALQASMQLKRDHHDSMAAMYERSRLDHAHFGHTAPALKCFFKVAEHQKKMDRYFDLMKIFSRSPEVSLTIDD